MSEVLKNGRTGVLVAAGDDERYVEEVLRLIRNPGEAKRIGQEAQRFIENDYSLETAVQRVEETYEELIARCA